MKWTEKIEAARLRKAMRDCPTSILEPRECVELALRQHPGKTVLGWSGGKCSTAVLHIALQVDPEIPVVFNDTGIESPETYKFVKEIREKWNVNLQILKPKVSFFKNIVPKYGYPMLRGQYKDSSKSKDGRPMCCQLLKEEPLLRFLKEKHLEAVITGLRVSESRMRLFMVCQKGQYYYAKTLKQWRYHPIVFWTTQRLERYHKDHQIPHNEVYDKGHLRCGCWPCTGYISWRESMAKSHPKMYAFLSKAQGQPLLWEYINAEKGCLDFT